MFQELKPKPMDGAPNPPAVTPQMGLVTGSSWTGTYRVLANEFNTTLTVINRTDDRIRLLVRYAGPSGNGSIELHGNVRGNLLELRPAAGYSHVESFNLQFDPQNLSISGRDAVLGGGSERSLTVRLQTSESR